MKNAMMDFSVDRENNKVHVKRNFAAGRDKVWAAWTQSEILDLWWAPKPWTAQTKSQEFRVGGRWLYAMVSPEGEEHWSFADYQSIDAKNSFSGKDGFCDESGNVNTDWPQSLWLVTFVDDGPHTAVAISITYPSLTDLEKTLEMGFQEGFTMGLGNLDEWLAAN
ncbi:SRPBCC family protein [Flavobacterium caeni]|uniref:Uncharacterized conserved protein YndB, AHSA1/START domain n=1 Tax=Flavobacterium caeni TaxID=490189 RepID=A0A1G5JW95_9FLAO|nr:SRPBCC domain-containing protein [Flavobacterium caeni]SCY92606.1 Uncharacterized conserved protein YndB, AHSA1/START domain [Flavobacterium caeni]